MIMPFFPYLNEQDFAAKMVYDFLEATMFPPLDCEIVLASRHDNPERHVLPYNFTHLREPRFFLRGNMNVAAEFGRRDLQVQFVVKKLDESMDEMKGPLVALVNQRILTLQNGRFWIFFIQGRQVGIVFPQLIARRPNIRKKP